MYFYKHWFANPHNNQMLFPSEYKGSCGIRLRLFNFLPQFTRFAKDIFFIIWCYSSKWMQRMCVRKQMCTARFWYWLTWSESRLNHHEIRIWEHLQQVRSGTGSGIVTLIQNSTSANVCFLVWKMSKYGIVCCHSWTVSGLQTGYFFLKKSSWKLCHL